MDSNLFTKYPHIDQYRQVVKSIIHKLRYRGRDENNEPIYDMTKQLPTLVFEGTIKVHGTNSAVGERNGVRWYQSRNHLITPEHDNQGFATFAEEHKEVFDDLFQKIYSAFSADLKDYHFVIYGEWCGEGIQKGTAIQKLSKRFYIFDILITNDDNSECIYLPKSIHQLKDLQDPKNNIYNAYFFPTFISFVNLNHPEDSLKYLEDFTLRVEKECPVAKFFNVSGSGEGIVWTLVNAWDTDGEMFKFKTKGEQFLVTSSEKKQVVFIEPEKFEEMTKFVDCSVTENRLQQGLQELEHQPSPQDIGPFIKWIINDILREEKDTIERNNFEEKQISKLISEKAKKFILSQI